MYDDGYSNEGRVFVYHGSAAGVSQTADWSAAGGQAKAMFGQAVALAGELAKRGLDRGGTRCGYPIGLSYPPDWGERTASIRTEDETVLQPGMTFHFMPALWMDTWGLETTETILIRESGAAEPLCSMDRKLFVKD